MVRISITIILVILNMSLLAQTAVPPAAGSGTEDDPYQIETLENLYWISVNDDQWDKHYIQTDDIDASETIDWFDGAGWLPIGEGWDNYFSGTYNGQGHIIDGLYIDRGDSNYIGLFGNVGWTTIKNLGLINVDINGNERVGSLAGMLGTGPAFSCSNCYSTGIVTGNEKVGGLIGELSVGWLENSYSFTFVNGNNYVGGLVGIGIKSTISESYSYGSVSGNDYVGGLVGMNHEYIYDSYSAVSVNGVNNVGGLAGFNGFWVTNSYSFGYVNGEINTGGLIGNDYNANVESSYWNIETSMQTSSTGGEGRMSEEMTYPYAANTYVNWDFEDIWISDEHYINEGYPYYQWQLEQMPNVPATPADFVIIPDAGGACEAELMWNNPHLQINGEPLGELTAVHIYRDAELIYTDDDPIIGVAANYTDYVAEPGLYTYRVLAENSYGMGMPSIRVKWVGEDVPAAVENLTLSQPDPDILAAELNWENPTEGLHGGAFNEPILGYHIVRSDGETFDLTGIHTSFLDDTIEEIAYYNYEVTAYNSVGIGGTAVSNTALINDEGLLVLEDFSGEWPPIGWEVTTSGANINWQQSNTNYAGGEEPEASFYKWPFYIFGTQRLITPVIDTSEQYALILEFKHYNDDDGGLYELRLETSANGEDWTGFATFPSSDFGPQTEEIVIQTADVGTETFRLAWTFEGSSSSINRWCVDDVSLAMGTLDSGFIEGYVSLLGGDGNVSEVEISANGIGTNPAATGFYLLELYPGSYDVTASLPGYQTETISAVEVEENEITTVDIELGNIDITVVPASFEIDIIPGEIITKTMTISNNGYGELQFNISVQDINQSRVSSNNPKVKRDLDKFSLPRRFLDTSYIDIAPNDSDTIVLPPSDDLFDLLDYFPVGVGYGEYSVATNGDFIYTSKWNGNAFYQYDTEGNYLGEFTVSGFHGNIRDMTFDGEYFYGSNFSNRIYIFDLDNQSLLGYFTTEVSSNIRAIAYDQEHDGFWVSNNWYPPLRLIDRNGVLISNLATAITSIAGIAWENVSSDGSYIWAHTQEGVNNNTLVKIDLSNGVIVQSFDVMSLEIINPGTYAGGIDITDQLIPGKWVFLGMAQNDVIWMLELCDIGVPWLDIEPIAGIVPAGGSTNIDVILDAFSSVLEVGSYQANIIIDNNAQDESVIMPVTMNVGLPTPLNLQIDNITALFSWEEPEYGGLELLEYKVYLDSEYIASTEETEYQFQNLIQNESYEPGVKAVYDLGESAMVTIEFTYEGTDTDSPVVAVTKLDQNFPNPFNPETMIEFSLSRAGRVTIEIFNIRGQKVRTLIDEEMETGNHSIVWNGRDEKNRKVGGGVYFYRLKSGDYEKTHKMLFLK